ncbi:tyrosine-type recombinase/integrase [Ruania alkalisoli]|uniref:Tyrosine-type recombinase/integrase n=1 Tax=Ruania alkalisoli TaxID=2779775 RepID=A0A7M1SNY6_9MICO|nr:tyrosine-type recombinase/integrase [Ruania alkalisoli]QOR69141.1 tyrosine-type recombinase/integrase [Ruania alkalisoli]
MVKRRAPDLHALVDSWELSLRAQRKSPETVKTYRTGVEQYLDFCREHDRPLIIDKSNVNAFTAHLLDAGREATTVRSRQLGVRRFSEWLADEDEIPTDPLTGIKSPKLDDKVVHPLTDDQLRDLLKACAGRELRERRDTALIRFMVETGTRAGEIVGLLVSDVDLKAGVAVVRRGKGGKGRSVPFGPQTGQAIDRYMRVRREHRLAGTDALWLGDRGKGFSYDGLYRSLTYRARLAGLEGFHPHQLRHTAAHRWLAAGGSEGGLMAVAGWTRPDMLQRYTKARAAERAAAEARDLNLGDL